MYSPVSGLWVIQLNELDLGCSGDCDVVGTVVCACVQVEKYFTHTMQETIKVSCYLFVDIDCICMKTGALEPLNDHYIYCVMNNEHVTTRGENAGYMKMKD